MNNRFLRAVVEILSKNIVGSALAVLAIVVGIVATDFSATAAALIFGFTLVSAAGVAVYAFHVQNECKEIFEILDHFGQWEIQDPRGQSVVLTKRLKVRFLQNHVLAIDDPAWGDGQLFAEYSCQPGVDVDKFTAGHEWRTLISLREFRNKGDIEEFVIRRRIVGGFTNDDEWVAIETGRTRGPIRAEIIFPAERPPVPEALKWERYSDKQVHRLPEGALTYLKDGRPCVTFSLPQPRRGETYTIKWRW